MTKSKQELITQIDDAMRVTSNVHSEATNFINSEQVIDGKGNVVSRADINESLDRSTRIVLDALKEAKALIEFMPFDYVA